MAIGQGRKPTLYTIDGFTAPARWWARQLGVSTTCLYYHRDHFGLTFEQAYKKIKKHLLTVGRCGYNVTYKPRSKRMIPR